VKPVETNNNRGNNPGTGLNMISMILQL